jgi:uncharacterized protein (DUF2235 family)
MPKTICIFSDGTGQAGGGNPTDWTNVYRLYVNTRDEPGQLCFYDPGIGSDPDQAEEQSLWGDIAKGFAKATGAGITRNIVDCYAALLLTYEPGDRVFLFGFSRGAYTVRSLGGAMRLCGVPPGLPKVTRWQDIRPHIKDTRIRDLALAAVREVYQTYDDKAAREAKAQAFRAQHGSEPTPPYFLGVWDTVRALGLQGANIFNFWRHRFHDAFLNAGVDHGRQALSVDENRSAFRPELWDERGAPAGQITQLWFAGVHTDIGGGYGLRKGLTDHAMQWMVDQATGARDRLADPRRDPHFTGLKVNAGLIDELRPDHRAEQHNERAGSAGWLWAYGDRTDYVHAPELGGWAATHPSVEARFKATGLPLPGGLYRPAALADHPAFKPYYA